MFKWLLVTALGICSQLSLAEEKSCSEGLDCRITTAMLNADKLVEIEGDWKVFHSQLLSPAEIASTKIEPEIKGIHRAWIYAGHSHGFATYQKEIYFSEPAYIGLRFSTAFSSRKIFLNDEVLFEQGVVGTSEETEIPGVRNTAVYTAVKAGMNTLTLQISNFHHYYGGHFRYIRLGHAKKVSESLNRDFMKDSITIGAILIMAFYHIFLWAIRTSNRGPLYFAIFCLCVGMRSSYTGSGQLLFEVLDPDKYHGFGVFCEYFGFAASAPFLGLFLASQFYREFPKKFLYAALIPYGFWMASVAFTNSNFYPSLLTFFQYFTLAFGILTISFLVLAIIRKRDGAVLCCIGFVVLMFTVGHDIFRAMGHIGGAELSHIGMFTFLFFQATILAYRFTQSFIQLDIAEKEIRVLNQELEGKVEERTKQINTILTNVQSGFLIVDERGVIQPGYTKSCVNLLGEIKGGDNCTDYFDIMQRDKDLFLAAINQVFADIMPESVNIAQIPSRLLSLQQKTLALQYSAIRRENGDDITGILLTVNDASDLRKAEEQVSQSKMLINILQNRRSFLSFLDDFHVDCAQGKEAAKGENQEQVRAIVHTLKGNVATFGLQTTAQLIHHLEDHIVITADDIEAIEKSVKSTLDEFQDIIGTNTETISVQKSDLDRAMTHLGQCSDQPIAQKVWRDLNRLTLPKAFEILGPIDAVIEKTSKQLGKSIEFRFTGRDCRVDPEHVPVIRNLIHLIRNSIDHGIEETFDRGDKSPEGVIELHFEQDDSETKIVVRDDGRGIDSHKVFSKALEKGLVADSDQQISDDEKNLLIFHPGLSTADETSELSGRGVGMHSIKEAIEGLSGSITIENKMGEGCQFNISLPRQAQSNFQAA